MGNLVFATDIHLNFCDEAKIRRFAKSVLSKEPTALALGGDLSEAPQLEMHLRYLEMCLEGLPMYFVCGNHDYYHGSVKNVREGLRSRFKTGKSIWLPTAGVVTLSPGAALVGHDGWYDGGYPEHGDWFQSRLGMSDYQIIQELSSPQCPNKHMRYAAMQKLARQGAKHIRKFLPRAFETYDKVFYVTHVSPFAETSLGLNKRMSDRDWMPSFCTRLSGEALMEVMKKMPAEKKLIVLCGHSHTEAWHRPLPNLYCYCGKARYGQPAVTNQFKY
jgi:UDP-2,3-diacylglucosamine pyrophosphatase LpxH